MKGAITVVSVIAFSAVVLFAASSDQKGFETIGEESGIRYPDKLPDRVLLPPDGSGKIMVFERHQGHSADWPQLKSSTSYWGGENDFVIEDMDFRPDSSLSKSVKYFPGRTPEVRAGLRRIAHYNPDGTFFKHEVHRKDGTLERYGAYNPASDQYLQTYYFEDGKTVRRHRIFNREIETRYRNAEINGFSHVLKTTFPTNRFVLVKEEVFFSTDDGRILQSQISCGSGGENCIRKIFNAKGDQISIVHQGGNVKERGEIFSLDGKQLLAEYELSFGLNPSKINFFREDGTRWQSLSSLSGTTEVLHFDLSGNKLLFKQEWLGPPTEKRNLKKVELFHPDTGVRTAIVYMSEKNYSVERVVYPLESGKYLEMHLNTENEVTKALIKSQYGPEFQEIQSSREKQIFDESIFRWQYPLRLSDYNFNDPNAPAWIYDYEDSVQPAIPARFP